MVALSLTMPQDGAAIAGGLLPLGKFVPANPLRTRVLSLVTQDTALYHVILANGALDMMTWRGEQFFDPTTRSTVRGRELGTVFCMKHKMEAIRIINERLSDRSQSVSDETILAVSHLAAYEVSFPHCYPFFKEDANSTLDVGICYESKIRLAIPQCQCHTYCWLISWEITRNQEICSQNSKFIWMVLNKWSN